METQFVTYDIALKLKELGFNEPCLCQYNIYKVLKSCVIGTNAETNDKIELDRYNSRLLAPLWQQVIDWFRYKYHYDIHITFKHTDENKVDGINSVYYDIEIYHLIGGDALKKYKSSEISDNYYIARKKGVLKAMDLLESELKIINIEGYKEFKEKVEYWTEKQNNMAECTIPYSYKIIFDMKLGWCLDVEGDVSFYGLDIKTIPIQFRKVNGGFNCSCCENLTSLKGCPIELSGEFNCSMTSLYSLEYSPKKIINNFDCSYCTKLKSLEHCPEEVGNHFICYRCGKNFTEKYIESLCNVNGIISNK